MWQYGWTLHCRNYASHRKTHKYCRIYVHEGHEIVKSVESPSGTAAARAGGALRDEEALAPSAWHYWSASVVT